LEATNPPQPKSRHHHRGSVAEMTAQLARPVRADSLVR
jgi:hypothetical protein